MARIERRHLLAELSELRRTGASGDPGQLAVAIYLEDALPVVLTDDELTADPLRAPAVRDVIGDEEGKP